jgi:hypothetical protein
VTVSDGQGGTTTLVFTIVVNNPAPIAVNDNFTTPYLTPVSGNVALNDSDPDGDALTFAVLAQPANGTVAMTATGTFTYTPVAGFSGTNTFTYRVTDADGATATATVTITVANAPPVLNTGNLPDTLVDDGSGSRIMTVPDATPVSLPLGPAFTDANGDPLNFSASGLPAGLTINPLTGTINGLLGTSASKGGPNSDGRYPVTVTVSDGQGGTTTLVFTIVVNNPAPIAVNDSFTTPYLTPVSGNVALNDSDPDGDALTFTVVTQPANGTVSMTGVGAFTYTPNSGYSGTDSFTYRVTDADGASASATVTVTVGNAPPVLNTGDLPIMLVDDGSGNRTLTTVDASVLSLPLGPTFTDANGDPLSFSASGLPAGLAIHPQTGTISGTFGTSASKGGPANDGRYPVTVTVSDGKGGTATLIFTMRVNNPAPVAGHDSFTTPYLTPLSGNVALNDSDPDGDALTYEVETQPAKGSATLTATGTFTYTPNDGFAGSDSFTYRVTDADGASATATVTIKVDYPQPVLQDDLYFLPRDDLMEIVNLLANDDFIDGTLELVGVDGLDGEVVLLGGDGAFQYRPPQDFYGTEVGVYTARDVTGVLHTAKVTLVSPAPVLKAASYANFPFPSGLPEGSYTVVSIDFDQAIFDTFDATVLPNGVLLTTFRLIANIEENQYVLITVADPFGVTSQVYLTFEPYELLISSVQQPDSTAMDPVLNPQTSLYEQIIEISNPLPQQMDHIRIHLRNLKEGVEAMGFTWDAATTSWVRDFFIVIPANGSVQLVLEYWSPRVQPFSGPTFEGTVPFIESPGHLNGQATDVRVFIGYGGHIYLEFPTRKDRRYQIRCLNVSGGQAGWINGGAPVRGTGYLYHWRDTEFSLGNPSINGRLYQVVEVDE